MAITQSKHRPMARWLTVLAACSLVFLAALLLTRRDVSAAEAKVDPDAQKVIDQFGKYYGGMRGFRVTVDIDLTVEQQGKKQNIEFVQKLAAERPNKFSYLYDGMGGGATIACDGKDLSVFIKGFKAYAVEEAPATMEDMFKNPIVVGVLSMGNATPVTMAVFSAEPGKKLVETAESIEYGGVVEIDDVKCHLLKAVGAQMDWQLWIDAGKEPIVRRFVPDLSKAFEQMAAKGGNAQLANMKVTNIVNYNEWEIDPKFDAEAFAFHVPEGVKKAGSLMEMVTGAAGARNMPAPHALLGKPAPPVDLELLDGGQLDLASYKEKNVVILDFWATWCGPCVRAMPIIEKVAAKYKDQGVLLFAVNVQETPDEIHAFLKQADLDVAVALDKQGAVAQAYLANSIPQTVMVGKDGTVQVVKIGLSPDLEQSLSGDIESLLAGKDLAAETLAKSNAEAPAEPEPKPAEKPKRTESKK